MPTVSERRRHIDLKVSRAKQHAQALGREIFAVATNPPCRIRTKVDQAHRPVYYVNSVRPLPDSIALMAGDVVQNLVTALDHLAYQLVCCDTVDQPPKPNRIYFPIFDSALLATSKDAEKKMPGASPATIAALLALQPYKGGRHEALWVLQSLNNIEKHRALFTVLVKTLGVHLGDFAAANMPEMPGVSKETVESMRELMKKQTLFLREVGAPQIVPGLELLTDEPHSAPRTDQRFGFSIFLSEPAVIPDRPLGEVVNELVESVEDVVATTAPLLR